MTQPPCEWRTTDGKLCTRSSMIGKARCAQHQPDKIRKLREKQKQAEAEKKRKKAEAEKRKKLRKKP
jgi:hypothetical protein